LRGRVSGTTPLRLEPEPSSRGCGRAAPPVLASTASRRLHILPHPGMAREPLQSPPSRAGGLCAACGGFTAHLPFPPPVAGRPHGSRLKFGSGERLNPHGCAGSAPALTPTAFCARHPGVASTMGPPAPYRQPNPPLFYRAAAGRALRPRAGPFIAPTPPLRRGRPVKAGEGGR